LCLLFISLGNDLKSIFAILCLCLPFVLQAQSSSDKPYHINGNAFQENCNCYTLTPDQNFQSGSVWNINKIDLRQSFDYQFEIYLGCTDTEGADGIAFVLQPISTVVGTAGNGLGFQGIHPSIGVLIDTWQNTDDNDPAYDHLSIATNGVIQHATPNDLTGAIPALPNNANIEDCRWHNLHIQWNAAAQTLTATVDGLQHVQATINLVDVIFGGNPQVFWGFSASTGGGKNAQRFCTSLNADFIQNASSNYCAPAVIDFEDHSRSFGSILEWHWDFGDGTQFNGPNPPPHRYSQPGNYSVSSTILGNNGCWSDTFKQVITIGSIPTAGIDIPNQICDNSLLPLHDNSTVTFGNINQWNWIINGQSYQQQNPDPGPLAPGPLQVQLQVATEQGCTSTSTQKIVTVAPAPSISLTSADSACAGAVLDITARSTRPLAPVTNWLWQPLTNNSNVYSFSSATAGRYTVAVTGMADNGCASDTLHKEIVVLQTHADAGRDTTIAINEPLVLHGSGGPILHWSPATGLSDPAIADPTALLDHDMTYYLTAATSMGCETIDQINIRVYKGPDIYVPNAFSPNADNRNDRLRFVAPGIRQVYYFRIYNRWGQLLYNSNSATGWDGRFQNREQASDLYIWMISGEDLHGRLFNKKGTVLLIR